MYVCIYVYNFSQLAAGSGKLDSKDFLGNLFPGGPASLQRKAEGAVMQEALQAYTLVA
jgi:hypothetical protein